MNKKTCLIIGGGRGMGAATAREMHARGYNLALMSPSESCEALAAFLLTDDSSYITGQSIRVDGGITGHR